MSGATAYVFFHARRHGVVESFSIHTHEVSGSTPVVQVTVYLSGRIIPVFSLGKLLVLERNYSGFGLQHSELEKVCVLFPIKISNWSGFFPAKPNHSTFMDIL